MLKPMIIFIIGFFTGLNEISREQFCVYIPKDPKIEFTDVDWSVCDRSNKNTAVDNKFIIFLPNTYFSSSEEPRIIIDDYINDKGFKITKDQVEGDIYAYAWKYTY